MTESAIIQYTGGANWTETGDGENTKAHVLVTYRYAMAQSCLETGNFTFSGSAVTLSQNNFCGLGVTQRGKTGLSFDMPQLGIRAQIQHLKAYQEKRDGWISRAFST